MKLSYKLEEMFPTEESRFDAYKKLIIISAICSPVMLIVRAVLEYLFRYIERTGTATSSMLTIINAFSFLAFLGILFAILSFYVVGYIYWKAKIIHAILKKILCIVIGLLFSFLIINIFITHLLSRSLFIFGPIASILLTPIVMISIIIIGFIVKRTIIRQYMEKYRDFVIDNLIIFATPFFCIGMVLFGIIISIISSGRNFDSTPVSVMFILAVIVYYAVPPICIVKMLNREKHRGNTFYNAMLQFTMAGFFILTLAFWVVKANDQLFFGDHDIGLDSSDAFDSSTIDSNDFTTDAPGMSTGFDPDMSQANTDTNPFMYDDIHNPDMNHSSIGGDPFVNNTDMGHSATFSNNTHEGIDNTEPSMNSHIDGAFVHSNLDLMDGNFMHVYGGTNMADISNIQHHPYMIFNDPSVQGNFQVCDPNGMPQMTISNGNIVDSEYKVIGHVDTDAISGTTTYKDINHNSILSIDSHRQMFSGNHYIGHIDTSGDVTVIRDMNNNIVARYDKLTHTWFDKMSKPISQIKMM